jgi:hypothetical protein
VCLSESGKNLKFISHGTKDAIVFIRVLCGETRN